MQSKFDFTNSSVEGMSQHLESLSKVSMELKGKLSSLNMKLETLVEDDFKNIKEKMDDVLDQTVKGNNFYRET